MKNYYKEQKALSDYKKTKTLYDKIEIKLPEEIKTDLSKIMFNLKRMSVNEITPEIKMILQHTTKIINYMEQEINFYSSVKKYR